VLGESKSTDCFALNALLITVVWSWEKEMQIPLTLQNTNISESLTALKSSYIVSVYFTCYSLY